MKSNTGMMTDEQKLYTGERQKVTIEIERRTLEDFRVAASTKNRGRTKGMMYIEYNNALSIWTKLMNGTLKVVSASPQGSAPIFSDEAQGGR